MLDVIKSYLVSLGFQVDNSTFNQAQQSMKTMDKSVETFAGNSIKNFAKAGTAVTSFFIAANIGISKYMQGLAKADLQNEMFARRMWMNKDSAVAYKNSLSALGAELQDLYLSPELLERYKELRSQATKMNTPDGYDNQMKQIRDVTFEFQRLKLESTYAMRWIGYYLFKYLEKPIGDVKKMMKELNESITKNMPSWTKDVAQVLSWIVRLGSAGTWAIQKLFKAMDELSPKTKVAGSAFLGFFALLKMGPIGWIIAGLTTLLLLLDDYKTYSEGGDSLFGDTWEKLDKVMKTLEDDGVFTNMISSLDSISGSLGNILDDLTEIADLIAKDLGFDDFGDMISQNLLFVLKGLDGALESIAGSLVIIDGILSGDSKKIKDGFIRYIKGSMGWFSDSSESQDDSGTVLPSYILNGSSKKSTPASALRLNLVSGGNMFMNTHGLDLLAQSAGYGTAPLTGNNAGTVNNYTVNNNPNYKIYGSEPTATARAISRNDDYGVLMRNLRGAY